MKKRVKGKDSHPINNGIKMQAHHLISCEGMKNSGLSDYVKKSGYDINLAPNMAYLPCTLQGACHLGVQLHSGNHTAETRPIESDDGDDDDDDDEHPDKYHKIVQKQIRGLRKDLKEACESKAEQRDVIRKLNEVSKDILHAIQNKPREARLTKIYDQFQPGSHAGCSNKDSVTKVPLVPKTHIEPYQAPLSCGIGRDHYMSQNTGQRSENISFRGKKPYRLNAGY